MASSPPPPTKRNKRATPRQATSDVAWEFVHLDIPDEDPLLAFEPVPHVRPRRNSITPELQRAFILHLAATGIVKSAAAHIGKSIEAIYKLRQRPGVEGFCGRNVTTSRESAGTGRRPARPTGRPQRRRREDFAARMRCGKQKPREDFAARMRCGKQKNPAHYLHHPQPPPLKRKGA